MPPAGHGKDAHRTTLTLEDHPLRWSFFRVGDRLTFAGLRAPRRGFVPPPRSLVLHAARHWKPSVPLYPSLLFFLLTPFSDYLTVRATSLYSTVLAPRAPVSRPNPSYPAPQLSPLCPPLASPSPHRLCSVAEIPPLGIRPPDPPEPLQCRPRRVHRRGGLRGVGPSPTEPRHENIRHFPAQSTRFPSP